MADIKKISKWIIIPCLFILVSVAFFLFLPRSCSSGKEPDNFTKESSLLIQENWSDDFISSIKLIVNSNDVYFDGKLMSFDDGDLRPIVRNDHAFLPVIRVSNIVRGSIRRDSDTNIIIETKDTKIEIIIGQSNINVNGDARTLPAASFTTNNIFMVSYSVMEYFGFDKPIWNNDSNEIILVKEFQTHRLVVITNGTKLIETYGAIKVIDGSDNMYVLQYSTEKEVKEANRLFNEDINILLCEPDTVLHSEVSADSMSWGVGRVGADSFTGHLLARQNNNEVTVSVLDTGIDFNHSFFSKRISNIGWNFVNSNNNPIDVHSHGSHVSGIIIDSTPPNVLIMPLKVLGDNGKGTVLNVHNAIKYAADNGADIINMSLGGSLGNNTRIRLYELAIDYAVERNVIVIASAGNENGDVTRFGPAYYSGVITVAATDQNDNRASFSNYGDSINFAAPGVSIRSAIPGGGFTSLSGTSMSAPFVSACTALLRTMDSSLTQDDIIATLSANADNVGAARYFGAGIVNVTNLIPAPIDDPIEIGNSVTGVILSQRSILLNVGGTEQLVATVIPANASNHDVNWSINNSDIATITQNGLASGVNYGNTIVTVNTVDGNYRASAAVVVLNSNQSIDLWKNFAAIMPFILILLLSGRVNLTKSKRSRQFIMPLIALIYCIVALVYAEKINEWISYGIALLGQFIPFIEKLNISKWLIYIFNTVIAVAFLIVKGILLPIISLIWSKVPNLIKSTSGMFYEYNDRVNAWVLKDKFGQAKIMWRSFYWASVCISSVVLTLSQIYPEWLVFSAPFYPVFGVLVMGEILFFLTGLTFDEMLSTIAGKDDEFYRIANYGLLRRKFHDLFENRILYDNTADSLFGLSSFEMLDNLAESDNKIDVVISDYFTELKKIGHSIDPGFVRSSLDMVYGKSVLINTPFYQDLTAYIVLPLVRKLMSYEKTLVIVGRDSSADDVKTWLHNGIAAFCGTSDLWKTGILTEHETTNDVAVMRFADVYNRKILDANIEFLNQVGFVLLIEPSRIVSTGQIGLSIIINQIGKNLESVVYCSCDRNCDGLVDTLSHNLKVNLTEVYATVPTLANCSLMYWNAHGEFMHHQILPNIVHYLGIGTELSSVALMHQIAKTHWVSSDRFPVIDMHWIAGQYYNNICKYINSPQSQEALAERFKVDANLWNLGIEDNAFLTVEDEFNNLFEMTRLYSTRARNQGFVNVISENYLLRNYMVEYASIFNADSKVIPSFVPDYTRTERNTVIGLIMRMYKNCVNEAEMKHAMSLAGIEFDEKHVDEKFNELLITHSSLKNVNVAEDYNDEEKTFTFSIPNNDNDFKEYERTFTNAYFIIEDDKDKNYYLGSMLYGQAFQKYLPGQFLTYSGKYYQVHTITNDSKIVLRRAADHIHDRKSYRQCRKYTLNGFSLEPVMGSVQTRRGIEIKRGFCKKIEVETNGYYKLTSLDNVAAAHHVTINHIPKRTYGNKTILSLKLFTDDKKSCVGDDVRYTVALLLNEIFVTLYPESYHYLVATTKNKTNENSIISKLLSPVEIDKADNNFDEQAIFIIEDCEIDLGLLVSFERNLTRILEIIADYLDYTLNEVNLETGNSTENNDTESEEDTEANDSETPPEPPKIYSENHYLYYGSDHLDQLINLQNTLQFMTTHSYTENALKQAREKYKLGINIEAAYFNKKNTHYCDFCAVELSGSEYDVLSDGRERCIKCAGSALKTVEQFTRIYENALRNMQTFFGIRINVPIKVRLADAKKIHKLCGVKFIPTPGFDGRILAFAQKDSDGYTIYVENGAPKLAAVANIVHELTHIWQYINWDRSKIRSHYGRRNEKLIYEGMAMWAEIQYLYFLNEISYAKRQEVHTRGRNDAYGIGFIKYAEQYPLIYGPGYRKESPFKTGWPLELPL